MLLQQSQTHSTCLGVYSHALEWIIYLCPHTIYCRQAETWDTDNRHVTQHAHTQAHQRIYSPRLSV